MKRRGFLGSVLGLVGGSAFLIEETPLTLSDYNINERAGIFGWDMAKLKTCRIELYTNSIWIKTPLLETVHVEMGRIMFHSVQLQIKKDITFEAVRLVDSNGRLIKESDFIIKCENGDTLKATFFLYLSVQ